MKLMSAASIRRKANQSSSYDSRDGWRRGRKVKLLQLTFAVLLACATLNAEGEILFSDNFNGITGYGVPGWYECERNINDVMVVGGALQIMDRASCFSSFGAGVGKFYGVSTVGYDNITLQFKWAPLTESESDDELVVMISSPSSVYREVATFALGGDGSFSEASLLLPNDVSNTILGLRFQTRLLGEAPTDAPWLEGVLIDDIVVEGTLLPAPCTLFEDNFEQPTGEPRGWDDIDRSPGDVSVVSGGLTGNALMLRNWRPGVDAAASKVSISTVNARDITLSFYWKPLEESDARDTLYVAYTVDDTNFRVLDGGTFALGGDSSVWNGPVSISVPASAQDVSTFGLRFITDVSDDFSGEDEGVLIDNVVLGQSNCIPYVDETPPGISNTFVGDVVFDGAGTVTATVTDADSSIVSATYELEYLDDSPGVCNACNSPTEMSASDGAFDELQENVTATTTGDLFVGRYKACVVGMDAFDNESSEVCNEFDVTPGQLNVVYNGEYLDLNESPTTMSATVSGPGACPIGAEVKFYVDDGAGGWTLLGTGDTDSSGFATLTTPISFGLYDVKVEVGDQDLGGTAAAECLGAIDDTEMVVVADPNAASTGGGFYMMNEHPSVNGDSPKANFGYTAHRKFDKELDDYLTTGNLLWMHKGHWRVKGKIMEGGKLPDEACPYLGFDVYPGSLTDLLACAAFAGEGKLYQYNDSYSSYCSFDLPCGQQWINPKEVEFTFAAYDGGSAKDCKGKGNKCKDVDKPDAFGVIAIEPEDVSPSEGEFLIQLKGGHLVVR